MTKKCILNKWQYPPIEYLENVYKEMHPIIKAETNDNENEENNEKEKEEEEKKHKKKHYTWSKDVYYHLINNNTEQYKNEINPLIRVEGTWIEPNDFFKCFNSFILLYNPNFYQSFFDWDNLYYDTNDFFSVNSQNKVLHFIPNENTIKTYFVLLFSVNSDIMHKLRDIPYIIHFILLSKDDKLNEGRLITLNSFFGVQHIDDIKINDEYFLIFIGGLFPNGFYMKFLSDFTIENLLYSDYLEKYQKFTKNTFNIEHGNLKENEISVILRLSVNLEILTDLFIVNNNNKDMYLNEFIEIYICENGNSNIKKRVSFENIISLEPRKYFIVITIIPPYNIEQNEFTIDVLSYQHEEKLLDVSNTNTAIPGEDNKPQCKIEQIEQITPYEITDKYIPNKHFILFKEYLFCGENIYCTLNITMKRMRKKEENEEEKKEEEKEKIEPKNNKKSNNTLNNNNIEEELIEYPFQKPLRIILELSDREKKIIYKTNFYNSITLHNLILETTTITTQESKNKKDPKNKTQNEENENNNSPYHLKCYFDESELPNEFNLPFNYEGIEWIIKIFSSDTLGFCEDTSKEDLERAIINSWEENEPGRAQKAKKSRLRYLYNLKKLNGSELEEDEIKLLNEPRKRRNEEEKDNESNVNNNKNKKGKNEKDNKKGKNEEIQNEEKERTQLDFNKKTSQVDEHASLYIKNFLFYAYDKRTITLNHDLLQENKELNTTFVRNNKEGYINRVYEDNERNKLENEEDIEKMKNDLIEDSKKFHEEIIESRKKGNNLEEILKSREEVKGTLLSQIEAEEKLKELINDIENNENDNNEKDKKKKDTNKFDFNNALDIYKNAINTGLHSDLIDKVFELLSKKKEEFIEEEMKKFGKGKEKELKTFVLNTLNDITQNKWHISDELLNKLDEISET